MVARTGAAETGGRVEPKVENEAALAWLATALEGAYSRGETTLAVYLEAVLVEILVEIMWELAVSNREPDGGQHR